MCLRGSAYHSFPSRFYSAQASFLPWPGLGSMFPLLKMETFRSDVNCPTSKAATWSWSGWTVVPSVSVCKKFLGFALACSFFLLSPLYYPLSSLTLRGPALCLNFGPSSELVVNEAVVTLLLICFPVFTFCLFSLPFLF